MDDLISRQAAKEAIREKFKDLPSRCEINEVLNCLPSAQERTGRWIWDDEGYHCSECFFHAYGNTLECLDGTYHFCPHCGADMNGVSE